MDEKLYESLFYQSLRIRLAEEKIIELYPSDKIQSPVHLSIGQESVAVCLCNNINIDDWVFINYRGHAYYLAKGGGMPEFFAELYGKKTGLSQGKAGSMHLADPSHGVMGASAVVASTISHAVGSALASKLRGENRLFVAVFGDGATEQGVYHESLNFASLHKLPVLFLCENNELAVHTSLKDRQAYKISEHAQVYNIKSIFIEEGFDIRKLYLEFANAVNEIKSGKGPILLEVKTCRYKEHVGPGEDFDAGYRNLHDIDLWKSKDPLINNLNLFNKFYKEIQTEIAHAVQFAESSDYPTQEDLLTDVF